MRQQHTIRFGVIAEHAGTPAQLLDTARRAEAAGCSTLLIRDHLVQDPFPPQLAPLTALAAVAAATTTLRVGTLVIANDFRHPAVLAKELATLDVLSGGRLEVGLGAGFLRREYDQAGLRFAPPGERVSRVEESLQVLRGLLAADGGPFTHHGAHYRIDGLDTYPKPVQRPHPPLHLAAAQPRMLGIAGRHADIVNLQGVSTAGGVMSEDPAGRSPDATRERIERVRQAAGDRFDQIELSTVVTVQVTDRPRQAAQEIARTRGWGAGAEAVLAMPSMLVGPSGHLHELAERRREEFGLSYLILSDAALDAAAPFLARVTGAAPAAR